MSGAIKIKLNKGHIVGAPKLIVADLKEAEDYFIEFFAMKVFRRVDVLKDIFTETLLVDAAKKHLALFSPKPNIEEPLKKTVWPVLQIDTPDLKSVTKKLEAAGRRVHYFTVESNEVAVTKDPSGNVVEIINRGKITALGGAKLIVENRQASENFYKKLFAIETSEYFKDETFDEAIFNFSESLYLALIEPTKKEGIVRSKFPVVAIYSEDYDGIMGRLKEGGFEANEFYPGNVMIAKDPDGNFLEIIRAGFDINSI